jgi:hypothetical protein
MIHAQPHATVPVQYSSKTFDEKSIRTFCTQCNTYVGKCFTLGWNTSTAPFITILAAPAVTTYDEAATEHGVILDNIWDESTLASFDPSLVTTEVTCPVLAAQEGYS